jgi:predicted  nucleic acid-binding Zn-ribbon protein
LKEKKLIEKMKFLIGLQDCDLRIKGIKRKLEEGPLRIRKLEEDLKNLEGQLQEELSQSEESKKERRRIDKEIEDLDSRVEKSQIKLSNIKSNKEYKAALKEVDDLKREKSLMEDRAIELMETVERLEAKCAAGKEEMAKGREKFETDREAIQKELKSLEHELLAVEKERLEFCKAVDRELLERYDFLKDHKGGVALSSVVNAVCQTCHMGIPAQKYNELIRGDALLTCPHCQRIIYWGQNEGFQKVLHKS